MLIGLNGRKQAGKDTVYERIALALEGKVDVERAAFADLMYRSAAASLAVDSDDLREWRLDERNTVTVNGPNDSVIVRLTIRQFIQRFGTEGHRNVFGEDFWVDQMQFDHEGRVLIVTDTRMVNEAEAVRRAGGIVVSVVGPEQPESADTHLTEAPLPDHLIDVFLPNTVRDDNFRTLDEAVETLLLYAFRVKQ